MSADAPFLLAFGDSLTAGYGLAHADGFAPRLEQALRGRWPGAAVHNAGVSGDTTAAALARLPRPLSGLTARPDLAIVELGANDLLRRIAPERTRLNLDLILAELARCGIPVLFATLEAPRFLGPLAATCDAIYAEVARRHGVRCVPFFPAGVMGQPGYTLADRVHPNARAVARVVEHLLPSVTTMLTRSDAAAAA